MQSSLYTSTDLTNPWNIAFIIIGLIFGIMAFKIYIKRANKEHEKLLETIQKLGLTFTQKGNHWFSDWEINGHYNDIRVAITPTVHGKGRNSYPYTKIQVFFKQNLNAGLHIYRENILLKIGTVFGGQDLKTGNEEFDKKFAIKATNEAIVLSLLQNSAVQETITNLFLISEFTTIDDAGIAIEKPGKINDENTYRAILDQLIGTTKIFNK